MLVFDKNVFGSNRSKDSNGYLRCENCNITRTQVAPYLGREIPNYREFNLEPDKIYYVLRPEEELKKAVHTFNNLPLTRKHIEVDVDNVPKEDIIGSLGDSAEFEDGFLKNSLIVYDQKYIDRIENGKQKELSCGYRYTPVRQSGEFEGQHYDFIMTDIVGNHIALVKEGRAGHDVVVADSKPDFEEKENTMTDITADEFVESEHPREKNGRFAEKGGEGSRETNKVENGVLKAKGLMEHLQDSIKAQKWENPDAKIGDTRIDSDRFISLYADSLSHEEYKNFSAKKAEEEIFNKLHEMEKEAGFKENDKINEKYSDFMKEKFGVSNDTKWKKSNTFRIGEVVRFRDGSIGKIEDISYPYGSNLMEIQAKTFDEDAENEDDYAYVSDKFSEFEKIDNGSKTTNDAIPDEQDKPETAGEEKADKKDSKMDKEEKKESVAEVKEEKVVEDKAVDKRKLIDEIGGILKGKVDDELIRTIIGKAEQIAYNGSEAGKADDEEKKEVKEELKEEKKEAEDKCAKDGCGKMAKDEMTFDIDAIKARVRKEVMADFKARDEARKSVKGTLGEINVMAFDSCEDIYKMACEKAGLNVEEIANYKDAFIGFSAGSKANKSTLALDAAPKSGSNVEECLRKNIRV